MELVNENKHRQLTPQVQHRKIELEIDPPPDRQVKRLKPDLEGGTPGPVHTSEGLLVGRDVQVGQTVGAVVFVDWLFAKPHASALGTLERIQDGLRQLVTDLRQVSGV